MKHQIRLAEPTDFTTLLAIDQKCFHEGIAFDESELGFYISQPAAITLVAEVEAQIVGFAVSAMDGPPAVATLVTLDVLDGFRRCGVGSGLLEQSERSMREQGALLIELQVATSNAPAIAFYSLHGFGVTDQLTAYYGMDQDAYRMGKRLVADSAFTLSNP